MKELFPSDVTWGFYGTRKMKKYQQWNIFFALTERRYYRKVKYRSLTRKGQIGMAGYLETFLKGKIAQAYQVLLEHFPQTAYETTLKLPAPTRAVKKALGLHLKKRHRAESLRAFFFAEDGHKVAAVLGVVTEDLVVAEVCVGKEVVTYGLDASGPFKEQWIKKLFSRSKKLQRKRVGFEELMVAYTGDDPDKLVEQIFDLLAEAILAIEQLTDKR